MAFCPFLCRIWSVHAERVGQFCTVIGHLYQTITYLAVILNGYMSICAYKATLTTTIYRTLDEGISTYRNIGLIGYTQSLNIFKVGVFFIITTIIFPSSHCITFRIISGIRSCTLTCTKYVSCVFRTTCCSHQHIVRTYLCIVLYYYGSFTAALKVIRHSFFNTM